MNKLALLPFLFLIGCKVEINAPISLSKIQTNETFTVALDFEVPACNDYEDSRKPSKGLLDLKKKVEESLPELEYNECYSKEMYSFASYNIDGIYINKESILEHKNDINIQIAFDKEENLYNLRFVLPAALRQKIIKLQQDNYISFTPTITVSVKNDTPNQLNIMGVYSYVNNHPTDLTWEGVSEPNAINTITLSNVMSDRLLLEMDENKSNAVYFMSFSEIEE